jgi:hypothetical protein
MRILRIRIPNTVIDPRILYLSRPMTRTAFHPGLPVSRLGSLVAEKPVIECEHQLRLGPPDLHLLVRS